MNTARLIVASQLAPQRWRNGGGLTRELLAWPAVADWQVRISLADIEADGPFSTFPGVERWFTVIEGAGVELTSDGAMHRLRRGDAPLCFDGGLATDCRLLDGMTRDLNLMLRGRKGAMVAAANGLPWRAQAAACGLYAAAAGRCTFDGEHVDLPAGALLWFDAAPAVLSFSTAAALVEASGWWLAAHVPESA